VEAEGTCKLTGGYVDPKRTTVTECDAEDSEGSEEDVLAALGNNNTPYMQTSQFHVSLFSVTYIGSILGGDGDEVGDEDFGDLLAELESEDAASGKDEL
jgi:hypothetical protein